MGEAEYVASDFGSVVMLEWLLSSQMRGASHYATLQRSEYDGPFQLSCIDYGGILLHPSFCLAMANCTLTIH